MNKVSTVIIIILAFFSLASCTKTYGDYCGEYNYYKNKGGWNKLNHKIVNYDIKLYPDSNFRYNSRIIGQGQSGKYFAKGKWHENDNYIVLDCEQFADSIIKITRIIDKSFFPYADKYPFYKRSEESMMAMEVDTFSVSMKEIHQSLTGVKYLEGMCIYLVKKGNNKLVLQGKKLKRSK